MTKEDMTNKLLAKPPFEFDEHTFEDIGDLLTMNAAYSNFQFKDGIRDKDQIIGGTSWVILDIDTSIITDTEAHLILEGINHYVVRTSDKSNEFKFRVILQLDTVVEMKAQQWKYFIEEISNEIGLVSDPVPQSQLYFSYAGRTILSELDGEPLETKNFIIRSSTKLRDKPKPVTYTTKQQKSLLDDPLETFNWAFNASNGDGSRSMIRAALYAKDLGANQEYIINLMYKINEYWTSPMEESRLENTIISQIRRY